MSCSLIALLACIGCNHLVPFSCLLQHLNSLEFMSIEEIIQFIYFMLRMVDTYVIRAYLHKFLQGLAELERRR